MYTILWCSEGDSDEEETRNERPSYDEIRAWVGGEYKKRIISESYGQGKYYNLTVKSIYYNPDNDDDCVIVWEN